MRGNVISLSHNLLGCYLTAKCVDCVVEQNSVRFTCCGKLANDHFSQSEVDQWSYDCYANYEGDCPGNKTSIGFRGCALTSLATLINYYAKEYPELNITPTEPGKLNKWLRDNEGYDENNNVRFWLFYNYTRGILDYINDDSCNLGDEGCETKRKIIDKMNLELMNKRPLILKIEYSGFSHYVITTGKCENKYVISDPAGGKEYLYDPYDKKYKLKGVRIFRWYIEMEE
ncbi:MAG: C39 family peptidase [Elusimicrobiales bacterium]